MTVVPLKIEGRRCTRCNEWKPSIDFGIRNNRLGGITSRCLKCLSEVAKLRYQTDRWKPNKCKSERNISPQSSGLTRQRESDLWHRYGLSSEQYNQLITSQGFKCICGKPKPTHVDHDHKTGKIRGILCRECNLILGYAGDSIERFERLIIYLKRGG